METAFVYNYVLNLAGTCNLDGHIRDYMAFQQRLKPFTADMGRDKGGKTLACMHMVAPGDIDKLNTEGGVAAAAQDAAAQDAAAQGAAFIASVKNALLHVCEGPWAEGCTFDFGIKPDGTVDMSTGRPPKLFDECTKRLQCIDYGHIGVDKNIWQHLTAKVYVEHCQVKAAIVAVRSTEAEVLDFKRSFEGAAAEDAAEEFEFFVVRKLLDSVHDAVETACTSVKWPYTGTFKIAADGSLKLGGDDAADGSLKSGDDNAAHKFEEVCQQAYGAIKYGDMAVNETQDIGFDANIWKHIAVTVSVVYGMIRVGVTVRSTDEEVIQYARDHGYKATDQNGREYVPGIDVLISKKRKRV